MQIFMKHKDWSINRKQHMSFSYDLRFQEYWLSSKEQIYWNGKESHKEVIEFWGKTMDSTSCWRWINPIFVHQKYSFQALLSILQQCHCNPPALQKNIWQDFVIKKVFYSMDWLWEMFFTCEKSLMNSSLSFSTLSNSRLRTCTNCENSLC